MVLLSAAIIHVLRSPCCILFQLYMLPLNMYYYDDGIVEVLS
jgi:hypothetical protein